MQGRAAVVFISTGTVCAEKVLERLLPPDPGGMCASKLQELF